MSTPTPRTSSPLQLLHQQPQPRPSPITSPTNVRPESILAIIRTSCRGWSGTGSTATPGRTGKLPPTMWRFARV